jgi:hypothetical protein
MRNSERHIECIDESASIAVLNDVRNHERRHRARQVSGRLSALALHIHTQGLNGVEAAELLRQEAERYEIESQELH